ncbi:TonB-dependent receptor domain-containing protein [Chryseobacterium indoltheticum]|uniref:Outer membrane receptor for Fe3+-dicitrate n=1 Tax=Chryseobacterium indoltheticum TaxID=254 RepID=A0A381F5U2_9FLAO|nr:TonB-dependent receptor [Chryseobacterium indoltheticum]AZA72306.1 TonB-dependent receptor [Chryseobacterium indoltheticum]SIR10002.1 Outer membrane receptor proteins, mostly Fe transport [Chryseobacterium indoltheticum]SUX41867.1 Outer membrane receptor for Fe3+-dicitrate [Chryseobacterium indoltheticum]
MKKTFIIAVSFLYTFSFAQKQDTLQLKTIESVTIEGKKKLLLERKADRLIFNVEASVASQGMDGAETLTNVPMLKVDENLGNISITGKSSVNVMVNGRMLNLSGTNLVNYLKTIRSENIAKIEVITTPPAKYEAQGNSGLINIILKKNPNLGWSGSVNTGLNQRTYSGGNSTGTLNYQTEKLSLSLKTSYADRAKRSEENYSILGASQNYSRSVRKDMWKELTPNLNFSYKLNKNSEIGIEYIFSHQKSGMDIVNETRNVDTDLSVENLLTKTFHREKTPTHTLSAYYDLKLDSLGKKLSFAGNFFKNNSDTDVNFSTLKLSDNSVQNVNTKSIVEPQVFSLQGDLELPFSFGTIETGLKFNQFKNATDLQYFNIINDQHIPDFQRANLFEYREENYAAYFSYAKSFGEHWETKAGLRYENTQAQSFTPSTNLENKYNYGQWFPSAFVSYKKDKNVFSLSYSRRINRPSMSNLNPFRWYENPYSYSSGNPLLTPSYINNLELGYTYNSKFSASIYYLKLKNGFGQVALIDGLSQIGTYLNYYNNNFYGFNASYTDKLFKFWETSLSLNGSSTDSKVFNIEAETQKGHSISYSINNTFTINKNKTVFFFLNYSQDLPYKNVNSYFHNFSNLTSGIKVSLMEKQLQINATVTNIFAQKYRGDMYFKDNSQHFNNYWDGRSFRLNINYTLGNNKKKRSIKSISFEEKDRAQ